MAAERPSHLQEGESPVTVTLNGRRYVWPGHVGLYPVGGEPVVPLSVAENLATALEKIKAEGKVCDEYETCEHRACRSSYASWSFADEALAEFRAAYPREEGQGWDPKAAGRRAVEKHGDALRRLADA